MIRLIFPDSSITMKLSGLIDDTYNVDSIKNMTRQKRCTSSAKFNFTVLEKNMLQGNPCQELLNDSEYKYQLIEMIMQYVLEFSSGILPRSIPYIITSTENQYFLLPAGNQVLRVFNHEEEDNLLVLHASKVDSDVAIVCKGKDILILMIWSYSKLDITNIWYLQYDHKNLLISEKYVLASEEHCFWIYQKYKN